MATDGRDGCLRTAGESPAFGPGDVVFRCQGCGVRFPDDPGGPGCCPRCGAIGGHERLGRPADRQS